MKCRIDPIVIDFETQGIQSRPAYPPKPVGVSIMMPGEKARYYGFGHPTENNCTLAQAEGVLAKIWKSDAPLLFHNAKFDLDVAETHLGLKLPDWKRVHDTLFLIFLVDPYAISFGLKESAERLLKMKPREQEAVRAWLINNNIVKKNDKKWGAHIARAPGHLVGRYAMGDVIRTQKLFKKIYPVIVKRGIEGAYDREREVMPVLLEAERGGICVDVPKLTRDIAKFESAMSRVETYLRKRLKVEDLNFDADRAVSDALFRADAVKVWHKTRKTGRHSTARKHLTRSNFRDDKIYLALGYRNRLQTCLSMFMRPWLATACKPVPFVPKVTPGYGVSPAMRVMDDLRHLNNLINPALVENGRIYTNYNQVRQSGGLRNVGARTGRLSTNPNFQNLPKSFYDKGDDYAHPSFLHGLPELPLCRAYILPDKGEVLAHRDYNQQELRILAHFEDAALLAAYRADPKLDVHTFVQKRIKEISGTEYERRHIKTMNFGMLYGMGIARLADTLKVTPEQARAMKKSQRQALEGLPDLEYDLRLIAKDDKAIRTWGGREYFCEPPKEIEGVTRTFEYKMLNYLIQGSAADCTKQALINYAELRQHGRFLVTVHDEINISVPRKYLRSELALLKQAMEAVAFDVPMLTDAKAGKNWASLKTVKEKR